MPIFEYQCSDCGHLMEILVKSQEQQVPECPECGGKKMVKQFSSFGVSVDAATSCGSAPACDTGCCSDGHCPYS